MKYRILEVGSCCASVPQTFADAFHTQNAIFSSHPYYTKAQKTVNLTSPYCITPYVDFESRLRSIGEFRELADAYQILHFHFHTLMPFFYDVYPLNYYDDGQIVVMHFHGDDIRNRYWERRGCGKFDKIFYSTPDLAAHCPGDAVWIPNPVKPVPVCGERREGPLRVLHVSTDPTGKRSNKGTPFIQNVMQYIQRNGSDIEFEMVTGLPHAEVLQKIRECDILIDQVAPYGIYGVVAVEAMYAGKPVIGSVNKVLYNNCPVVAIHADGIDLKEQVLRLAEDADLRETLGQEGIHYAWETHNPRGVADRLMEEVDEVR